MEWRSIWLQWSQNALLIGLLCSVTFTNYSALVIPNVHPILRHQDVCGISQFSSRQPRVVNGSEVQPHKWPWQVSMSARNGTMDFVNLCGGAILSREWILTAAHCFGPFEFLGNSDAWTVVAGEHEMFGKREHVQISRLSQIILHEEYIYRAHDIALVKLAEPLNFTMHVHPICLPPMGHKFPAHKVCTVVGWPGRHPYSNDARFHQVELPIIPHEMCAHEDYHGSNVTDKMLCAEPNNGDSCEGDSGRPLMCQEGEKWMAAGIVSWGGEPCGVLTKPGVYTKVSEYVSWIFQKICEVEKLDCGERCKGSGCSAVH